MDVPTEIIIAGLGILSTAGAGIVGGFVWWAKRQERRTAAAIAEAIAAIQAQVSMVQGENDRLRKENVELRGEVRELNRFIRDGLQRTLDRIAGLLIPAARGVEVARG